MGDYREITIGNLLRETASRYPDHEALVCPEYGVRQSYREFLHQSISVAKGFLTIGIQKGDHVAVWATNVPEWLHLQFGLAMIGAVLVTVNTSYKSRELEYILRQSASETLVYIAGFRDSSYNEIIGEIIPDSEMAEPGKIRSLQLPQLRNIVYIGEKTQKLPAAFGYSDIIRKGERVSDGTLYGRERRLNPHEIINMQYTSGTTGFPKGVMLSHYNIINNARMIGDVTGMSFRDRLLIQVPLFHCFGCVVSSLSCVCCGSTMVVSESFSPRTSLHYIDQEKCTAINGVPTMFIAMLNHEDFDRFDLSSLRTGIMAGAPCPVETMRAVMEKMHCKEIVIAYGQTECSPVMTMTRRNDPVEIRISTVGKVLDGVEGKVVDLETGEDLPVNSQGEIVTRGPCVMKGYYNMPEETKKVIDEGGWLHTGDLGEVDEKGYFRITGRIKEMIIRGGENIYPREIEEFLHSHSKVKDVYVIGIPDKKYGEQILAVIILRTGEKATAEEFIEFCHDRIARHKIPKYWEFVTDVPTTASGKVQKFKLVKNYSEKYPS